MYFKKAIDAIGYIPPVELAQMSPNSKARILAKLKGQNPGGKMPLGIHMFISHLLTSMLYKDIILKNLVGVVQWHPGMKKDKE